MRKSTINGHFLYSYVKLPEGTNHIHSPRTSARYFEVELTEHSDPKYNRWLGPSVGATKKDKVRNRKKAGSIMDYPPHNKKGLQEVRMFRTLDLFSRRQLNRFQKNTIPLHIPKNVLIVVLCRVQKFQKLPLAAFAAPAVVSSLKPHESYPAESRFWKTYPAERSGNPWLHKDCQEPKLSRQRFRRYS